MGEKQPPPQGDPPAALLPLGFLGLTLAYGGALADQPWGPWVTLIGTILIAGGALSFAVEAAGAWGDPRRH